MGLSKYNIALNLQHKSVKELTEIYNFLINKGENVHRDLMGFICYRDEDGCNFIFGYDNISKKWMSSFYNKTIVSVEEFYKILNT